MVFYNVIVIGAARQKLQSMVFNQIKINENING